MLGGRADVGRQAALHWRKSRASGGLLLAACMHWRGGLGNGGRSGASGGRRLCIGGRAGHLAACLPA